MGEVLANDGARDDSPVEEVLCWLLVVEVYIICFVRARPEGRECPEEGGMRTVGARRLGVWRDAWRRALSGVDMLTVKERLHRFLSRLALRGDGRVGAREAVVAKIAVTLRA